MKSAKEIAEQATMQSFLNCYMREIDNFENMCTEDADLLVNKKSYEKVIHIPLTRQNTQLLLPIKYWSLTGRHLFEFPLYYQVGNQEEWQILDYVTMAALLVKEWLIGNGKDFSEDELLLRVVLSCKKIRDYVEHRMDDRYKLVQKDFDFIEAEQSLLFGHLLHPTPKSKQGLTEREDRKYSPEYKGRFQLHYFSVDPTLIDQDSSLSTSASDIIMEGLRRSVDPTWLNKKLKEGRPLIPVHPLQVASLLDKPEVQKQLSSGALEYIGPLGDSYTATSSFRTLYSPASKYMYKFSVPVKITNSLRVNKPKELVRGTEIARLLDTKLENDLKAVHPDFSIIKDPAYINLQMGEEVSGFEVVIRENPFYENSEQASVVAALVQDHAYGGKPRIHAIIEGIAEKEGRSLEEVSIDWFHHYLSISLDPILWLFKNYGIALEAHQQNAIIRLKDGYPAQFYYRDNQGYYFCKSQADQLSSLLPDISEKSDTICADEVAEERLRYYFFFNHIFGLINGFGTSGLIAEEKLMDVLRDRLKLHSTTPLTTSLLENEKLPCKANLLTRLYDMDELVGPMESQSVYTTIQNPLAEKVAYRHGL